MHIHTRLLAGMLTRAHMHSSGLPLCLMPCHMRYCCTRRRGVQMCVHKEARHCVSQQHEGIWQWCNCCWARGARCVSSACVTDCTPCTQPQGWPRNLLWPKFNKTVTTCCAQVDAQEGEPLVRAASHGHMETMW